MPGTSTTVISEVIVLVEGEISCELVATVVVSVATPGASPRTIMFNVALPATSMAPRVA